MLLLHLQAQQPSPPAAGSSGAKSFAKSVGSTSSTSPSDLGTKAGAEIKDTVNDVKVGCCTGYPGWKYIGMQLAQPSAWELGALPCAGLVVRSPAWFDTEHGEVIFLLKICNDNKYQEKRSSNP